MLYSKIQYVSQGKTAKEQFGNIQLALDAGCSWIQLRYKNADEHDLLSLAEEVALLCKTYHATFIINDQVPLVSRLNADGVHLGLQDMPVSTARKMLGAEKIIGGTANTLTDVLQRVDEGCNYVGLGPFRFTTTKEKLSPVLGLTGYADIISNLKNLEIEIPIYAIGGIALDDVIPLTETGIYGIAVSGLITNYSNKKELIKKLKINLYAPTEYSGQKI